LGANPINVPYHYMAHNPAALPDMLLTILIGAGWGEETLFRGFLFERLGKLFGASAAASFAVVLVTAGLFGLAHLATQGWDGVKQATIVGLVFGAIYARTGQLFPLMIAHAAFDLTALTLIYFDLESTVAHAFFK